MNTVTLWVVEQYRPTTGEWLALSNTATYTRESAREEMAFRKTWKTFRFARLRVVKYVRGAA